MWPFSPEIAAQTAAAAAAGGASPVGASPARLVAAGSLPASAAGWVRGDDFHAWCDVGGAGREAVGHDSENSARAREDAWAERRQAESCRPLDV